MSYPILFLRIACTVEGTLGCLLNVIVVYLLTKSRLDPLFRIAICFWSIGNFVLSLLVATLQFVHVFLDCNFIFVIFNPFIGQIPKDVFDAFTMVASALCSSLFIFIPTLGGLQLMALTKPHWNPSTKFVVAFVSPLVCIIVVGFSVPQLLPTPELDAEFERVTRAKFEINDHTLFYSYGGTMSKTEINGGRHFLVTLSGFIAFPFIISYAEMAILMIMAKYSSHDSPHCSIPLIGHRGNDVRGIRLVVHLTHYYSVELPHAPGKCANLLRASLLCSTSKQFEIVLQLKDWNIIEKRVTTDIISSSHQNRKMHAS